MARLNEPPARRLPRVGCGLAFGVLLAALLAIPTAPAAAKGKDKLPRIRLSPEFKYVDAPDEETAAELLPKLLKKYADPKKCQALLKILRTKRPYPGKMPSRGTFTHVCSDGKPRQFTYLMPKKYSKRKPTGVLFFLHGAVRQGPPGGGAHEAQTFGAAVKSLNLIVVGPSTYEGVEWGAPPCRWQVSSNASETTTPGTLPPLKKRAVRALSR